MRNVYRNPPQSPSEHTVAGKSGRVSEVEVPGSPIQRVGFGQPTPKTVIDDVELRQGARLNLQHATHSDSEGER